MTESLTARTRSLDVLKKLGYRISPSLPLLDGAICRDKVSVSNRLLTLFAVVALSYGWKSRQRLISDWLQSEELVGNLTPLEAEFVVDAGEHVPTMQWRLETLLALAWACKMTDTSLLDPMPDDLVAWFPSVQKAEPTAEFVKRIELRSNIELLSELDLMYCLASAKTDLHLHGEVDANRNSPDLYTVQQRRHALEWLLFEVEWEDVELDT